uniref:RING-type domain-containing protein n=1 Tax=Catharus ustulatus TaxID=91951 RepID=A0A8C3Y5R3_CATUS
LPIAPLENYSNCLICQDTPKDVASALPCHHQFCLGCILRWTQTNPLCPLCRTPIETVRNFISINSVKTLISLLVWINKLSQSVISFNKSDFSENPTQVELGLSLGIFFPS